LPLPRFYVRYALQAGAIGALTPDQTRQARSVLRLGAGSRVALFDGSGVEAIARILVPLQAGATWEVESVTRPLREPPLRLTVGLALLRGERFEVALQKLTELGVTRICPLSAERSVVSFDVACAWERKLERFQRIVQQAAEQSERVTIPSIDAPVPLGEFLQTQPAVVLVERGTHPSLAGVPLLPSMALAVGPEGGWSERELQSIARDAAGTASLGRLILRAETAAIVAAGTLIQRAWAEPELGNQGET
jgi:16S rRNA (uracil1498-N3)-methyltransferase